MADEIKIEKDKLDELIAEVCSELKTVLKSEGNELEKADKEPPKKEESKEDSASAAPAPAPEASATPPAPAAEASATPPAAAPMAPPAAEAAMAPEGSPTHEAGEIEPAPTVEELTAEYAKLPPEDCKMHYLAAKTAMEAMMGAPGPEASMAPPAAAPMAPPAAAPPMALKAEMPVAKEEMVEVKKSETDAELEGLKVQLTSAKGELDEAQRAIALLADYVTKPVRKSIKSLSELQFIGKDVEEKKTVDTSKLSRKEVLDKLCDKARTSLNKSDRDLINGYTVGSVDISKIEHLLTETK